MYKYIILNLLILSLIFTNCKGVNINFHSQGKKERKDKDNDVVMKDKENQSIDKENQSIEEFLRGNSENAIKYVTEKNKKIILSVPKDIKVYDQPPEFIKRKPKIKNSKYFSLSLIIKPINSYSIISNPQIGQLNSNLGKFPFYKLTDYKNIGKKRGSKIEFNIEKEQKGVLEKILSDTYYKIFRKDFEIDSQELVDVVFIYIPFEDKFKLFKEKLYFRYMNSADKSPLSPQITIQIIEKDYKKEISKSNSIDIKIS